MLGPAIAAISLGLVGHAAIGERFGRNARFASIGAGLSAGVMGAFGYFFTAQAVFFVTAALLVPALLVLRGISPARSIPSGPTASMSEQQADTSPDRPHEPAAASGRCRCSALASCCSTSPTRPCFRSWRSVLTMRSGQWATILIAACIVGPQLIVALFSPWVGQQAERWGRRPLLLAGFAALPIRGFLLATVTDPYLLVAVQLLDGLTAAVFSVMVPLTVADLTRGTGRFNLTQGIVGTAMGIGASLSPTLAGYISDTFSSRIAFLGLASIAVLGLATVWLLMPETRSPARAPSQNRQAVMGPLP